MLLLTSTVNGQAVSLGDARDFAIISAAGVTNSGFTIVNGNIALSPTPTIIGFINALPSSDNGIVNGVVHYNDSIAQAAQLDARTAYNTLAGMAPGTNLTGMDLGGMSLAPGTYSFNSSAFLTGNLTLATGSDQNAAYVFQIGSTLVTATTSQVIVTGMGAATPNIFWQVGSSATLENGTLFSGNILADISITMKTGANLANGRAIALTGAVSLLTNNISAPVALAPSVGRYWNGYASNQWSGINWSSTAAATDQVILGSNMAVVFSVNSTPNPPPIRQNTVLDTDVTISSLTVNDTAAVTIGGSKKLTITATGLITGININPGAGLTTINSNLELGLLSQIIDVNNVSGMVVNGVISGTNGLTKAGTGLLVITGVETYTGATVVSGGTLQLGNGVIEGSSIASSNSILIAPDGVLAINLANGETFRQNVTDNGQIRWIAPGTNTQASTSVFSGTGGMQVNSLGTAIILGNNTYTGATVITDGILQLGNGVIAGSSIASISSILIAPDGVLAINLANGETFSQNVTDNGQIRWIAPGTNTQASTSVFSGTGSMLITAPTRTVLLGDNTFGGGTTINTPGEVLVGNVSSNTSSPFGEGVLTINQGRIDTVHSQLLQIEVGGYVQTGGEIAMHLEGTDIGDYTRYIAAGTANLSGGTVFVYDLSGNYVPYGGDEQNIIHTTPVMALPALVVNNDAPQVMAIEAGNLTGEFADNYPQSDFYNEAFDTHFYYHRGDTLLYPTLTYDPDNAYVTWVQDSFVSLPDLTPNQEAVGGRLDGYVAQNPGYPDDVVAYLNGQNLEDLPAMYDLIAPDELTALFQMGFTAAGIQNTNIQRHLERVRRASSTTTQSTQSSRDSKGGLVEETITTQQRNRWNFFFEGTGGSASVDPDRNASGYDFDSTGGVLGADMRVNDHLVIGILGSYTDSDASLVNGGSIDAESFNVAAYATVYKNGYFLDALIGAGFNSYDTKRASLLGYAEGSPESLQLNSMLNAGYDFRRGQWTVTPNASIAYTRVNLDEFDETGSLSPLSYPDQHQESLRSEVGVTIAYDAVFNGMKITPQARIAWQHEFLDSTQTMDSRFIGGSGPIFSVSGPQMDRERTVFSAGISAEITQAVTVYAFYDGQFGSSHYDADQVTVGCKISF
jgi:type VI secretion system secreted protein VgrG